MGDEQQLRLRRHQHLARVPALAMTEAATARLACERVDALLPQLPAGTGWLSVQEQARLGSMERTGRRSQFVAARWLLRQLLVQAHGGRPQDWPLDAPADAPPRVQGHAHLHVSLSHSGAWVAAAVAAVPVGIDVEVPRRERDVEGLVALCCTPAEQRSFEGLAAAGRHALFHQLWTAKESWLKRRGEWLAPARLVQLEATPHPQGEVRCWRMQEGWLALCVDAGELHCDSPAWQPAGRRRISDLSS
ncbi:MAG: 4'-phosphopantetheinyl transferase superfamily protein [Comamonadaceae bacterium]|nr:MAG: 4'-phosphopantetheinyl transferase superfamily protein [Comamonadaceae bacterium]